MREFTTPTGDAPLHEPILRKGGERSLADTRKRARRSGWTEKQIERAYGRETKRGDF